MKIVIGYSLLVISALLSGCATSKPVVPKAGSPLTQSELAIWNDPAFKKQFTESYLAETEIEPRVTVVEREDIEKILKLISSDKMDDAVRQLEGSRGKAASAVFDFTLANIYFQQEKLPEAASAYEAAVAKYPKFRRAHRNLGLIYVRQNEFKKAVPALTRVIELGGGDALTYGLLGFAYSSSDNSLSAESAYRMAVLIDPVTLDWQMGLARSLFKQERYAEAAALGKGMIEAHPERADLWLLQANAYIGLNQPLKAAENYELVDRLGQASADSLNMLGDIYVNESLFEMAVNSYIRALEKNPDGSTDRAVRASKVLIARGALDETRKLIARIEELSGERLQAAVRKELLKLRARIAVAEGAGVEEVKVLEEIVALDPLDGEALILLGQHYVAQNQPDRAIFYYERAESMEAFEVNAKIRHAQVLVGMGRYAEAIPLLRRVLDIKPNDDIATYLKQVERISKNK